jgi:DnaK suppressor protein
MKTDDISRFRRILEANVVELTHSVRRRDALVIEKSAEPLDRTLRANERDMAARTLEFKSSRLRDVQAALRRMHEGTYGICEQCDEPISTRRLAAIPSATLCIRCQESHDCDCAAPAIRPALRMAA